MEPLKSDKALDILRVDGRDPEFVALTRLLDEDLDSRYGEQQKSYNAYNRIDVIRDAVVVHVGGVPAACGAFKAFSPDAVEIKRIFVFQVYRGQGLARLVMAELEAMAGEQGYSSAVLETGAKQPEAIGLYRSLGYETIANYGQYAGNVNSVCMSKKLAR